MNQNTENQKPNHQSLETITSQLQQLGLAQKQAIDTARNSTLAQLFIQFSSSSSTTTTTKHSTLLLRWANGCISNKLKNKSQLRKQFGAQQIIDGHLTNTLQVDGL